ncbi:unnamed protein product [Penicillium salamii]|uniref:Uncharacterized protein n=1 Tax=Penicillium salamii TaxID=1612424 RepID=A0A9W4K0J4_9EURO|nr:unnamed protein product [Penicillium salamii]CAG8104205.1 unnamed protein product [Penicillium salamii]CAG8187387.1 unnamed protein product [Penicillium salamii]CAG8245529.1 unnamed protein product [Penicillium salamii]CAG8279585.1 unnamed protein product [Penicillium salamii]
MGNKVSVVRGVKSDHFYNQQNGINEIWVGDVEIISRLPFGDSDQEQSSWPPGGVPKIPWHQFIIPLHKRDEVGNMSASSVSDIPTSACYASLPTSGYYGMFTGMPPRSSYQIGVHLLFGAAMMGMFFVSLVVMNFVMHLVESDLSIEGEHRSDCALLRRQRVFHLRILLMAAAFLAFSILLAALGLSALAAGIQHPNASFWILDDGIAAMFVAVMVVCWYYIKYYIKARVRSANTNQAEDQNLQTIPATCESEKV